MAFVGMAMMTISPALGGVNDRNGRCSSLRGHRGETLGSSRVRDRDAMAELAEVTRKYASHASSADDSNPHVHFSFSNLVNAHANAGSHP